MSAAEDKNPWLGLARISGDHEENKRLWNGYQKYLLRPNIDEYQRQLKNPKFLDIVDLSDAEIHSIQTEIPDLPKDIGDLRKRSVVRSAIALTQGIPEIQTRLELDGFYFAFRVFIQNTTFKSLLTLQHAQFAERLDALECVFEGSLIATDANFGSNTLFFYKCHFIANASFHGAKFKSAIFHQAKFKNGCNFKDAEFAGRAVFTDSIFTDSANFDSVEFHGVTSFDLAAASSAAVPLTFKDAKFFKHPPIFLAARCMKIPIGRALHYQTTRRRRLYLELP